MNKMSWRKANVEKALRWERLYYQKRRKMGLCVYCSKLATRGGYCEEHHDSELRKQHEKRIKRLEQGMCPQCGKQKGFVGRKFCLQCLAHVWWKESEFRERVYHCRRCGEIGHTSRNCDFIEAARKAGLLEANPTPKRLMYTRRNPNRVEMCNRLQRIKQAHKRQLKGKL